MRFVPLVPSEFDPVPWGAFSAVELAWNGPLHPGWARAGLPVHAVHLGPAPWSEALGERVMEVLRARLDPDFLVLGAAAPDQRLETSRFLGVLEGLLEITQGQGIKLALRPAPGSGPALARLLKEARGEAVGFCWDAAVGGDLEALSDRLFTAVGQEGDDFSGLQVLGYRWNVAVPATGPAAIQEVVQRLEGAHPQVYFPAGLEVPPDPAVRLGRHLEDHP